MAAGASKAAATLLFMANIALYFIVTIITSSAVNHTIERSRDQASVLSLPANIFPIYSTIGNTATGFFITFALLAGVVGITTSLTGLQNVLHWNAPSLHAASFTSLISLGLTLLAMGFGCEEISIGWTECSTQCFIYTLLDPDSTLERTLEVVTILVSVTQLFCTGAVYAGVEGVSHHGNHAGRV